jgi:hypothetical protein
MNHPDEIDPRLNALLAELKPVPPRDLQLTARQKARFLSQASILRTAPHSQGLIQRLKAWNYLPQNEQFTLATSLLTVILALILLFGGVGTAYAAQSSLPNQALYPVKTMTEDVRLSLVANPQIKVGLLMEFTQTRVNEIQALSEKSIRPPAMVLNRLTTHLGLSIQIAGRMDDVQLQQTLSRISIILRNEEHKMDQFMAQAPAESGSLLLPAREQIHASLLLVDVGLNDPRQFRERIRNQNQPSISPTLPAGSQTPVPLFSSTPSPTVTGITLTPASGQGDSQNGSGGSTGTGNPPTTGPNPDNTSSGPGPNPTQGNSVPKSTPPVRQPTDKPGGGNPGNDGGNEP